MRKYRLMVGIGKSTTASSSNIDYKDIYEQVSKYIDPLYKRYASNGKSYLDRDDFIQEGVLAVFLSTAKNKNKEIWSSIVEAVKKTYPFARTTYPSVKDGKLDHLLDILKGGIPYHDLYDDSVIDETDLDKKVLVEQILDLVNSLEIIPSWNGQKRRLMEMYYVEGYTHKEIGIELGYSTNYIEQIHKKIINALKKKLGV
jgi:RNA polymerase sigma factor (sigma-70 family)